MSIPVVLVKTYDVANVTNDSLVQLAVEIFDSIAIRFGNLGDGSQDRNGYLDARPGGLGCLLDVYTYDISEAPNPQHPDSNILATTMTAPQIASMDTVVTNHVAQTVNEFAVVTLPDPTTNNPSFQDIPELTLNTINTTGKAQIVLAANMEKTSGGTEDVNIRLQVNGVTSVLYYPIDSLSSAPKTVAITFIEFSFPIHRKVVVKAQWKSVGGAEIKAIDVQRHLQVIQVP